MNPRFKHGDFTTLAKDYINRPGYSLLVLKNLGSYVDIKANNCIITDVGAGTGKLTENLLELDYPCRFAVEPNEAMRSEGIRLNSHKGVKWIEGSAESTGLEDESVNWILMASSFHWTQPELALKEFKRILKPSGFFTALWNPRDLERSSLHMKIEQIIHEIVPDIKRVSSGSAKYTKNIENTLVSTGYFKNILFVEASHEVIMSKERYMGAWKSVNDIQVQAGTEGFQKILEAIDYEIKDLSKIVVPYKTRSWTAQVIK
jgi:ubiquinone/menaquinone biosynthesis C-methylase UbiE